LSAYSATAIPKPKDEQTFERASEVLWRCVLNDPNAKLYGRRGQKQNGVDIVGKRDGDPDKIVGIQCKQKGDGKTLSEQDDVRSDVEKAKNFEPALSELIFVTTAPDDRDYDNLALTISKELKDAGFGFTIQIMGWGCLEDEIVKYP